MLSQVSQGFLKPMSGKEQVQPVIWFLFECISVIPIMHFVLHSREEQVFCSDFRAVSWDWCTYGDNPLFLFRVFPYTVLIGSPLCFVQFQRHRWTVRFPCGHPGDCVEEHVESWEPRAELVTSVFSLLTMGPPALSLKKRLSVPLITVFKPRLH